ncbi:MAG: hypothetical protein LW632_11410 [Burkholderiaceae bacterium]|nr:hypothetical protein [Burkholderiaceae bacterium]
MQEKYSLKVIQNGQTQTAHVVRSGAGAQGQALVLTAEQAARYQLINMVTLSSPAKLLLKKKGHDLHLALPGSDVDMPDIVIKDYYAVDGNRLQGLAQNGEWMVYDTATLLASPAQLLSKETHRKTDDHSTAVALANPPMALLTSFDSPMGLAGIGAGVAVVGASGGGEDGGSSPSDQSPGSFEVFNNYAKADTTGKVTAPTKANYVAVGVTLPSLGNDVKEADVLDALNRVVNRQDKTQVVTQTQLQALADALKSSYSVILAKANGATAEDTSARLPTVSDYANVGVTLGTVGKPVELMNSVLVELSTTQVDSPTKLNNIATACDNLMKLAAGTTGASVTPADLLALGLKINNQNAGITSIQAKAFSDNLANLHTSLGKSGDVKNGDAVDTQSEVQALFSLQAMRSFNDDAAALDKKTQPAPGLSDYTNIGVKAYKNLTDTSDASRVNIDSLTFASGVNWQTTLNSALDTQVAGTALTKTVLQTMVDAYYKILREAGSTTTDTGVYVNDATHDPQAKDYNAIGITQSDDKKSALTDGKTLKLLNDTVGRSVATKVDTVAELQALQKAAENVMAVGAGTGDGNASAGISYSSDNANAEWLQGFQALGVSGVTASNLAAVRQALDTADSSNDGAAIDTVVKLQAIISRYLVNEYAVNDVVNPAPTLADYQAIMVKQGGKLTDVVTHDGSYLTAYNDAVKAKPTVANVDTFNAQQIKNMVLSFNTILNEADGDKTTDLTTTDPTKADFENVGLGNGVEVNLQPGVQAVLNDANLVKLFADVVGAKIKDQVNSIKELNDLAVILSRIDQLVDQTPTANSAQKDDTNYNNIIGGRLTVKDFQDLGLDTSYLTNVSGTVQNNRINSVMDKFIALNDTSAIDNLLQLQSYINSTSGINA